MRVLVQRVASARVEVDGAVVGAIGTGLLAFVGVAVDERGADVDWCADKVVGLRVFRDAHDHLNRSVGDVGGAPRRGGRPGRDAEGEVFAGPRLP